MDIKLSPIHPGEVLLEDFMKPLGLSANALAIALRVYGDRDLRLIPSLDLVGREKIAGKDYDGAIAVLFTSARSTMGISSGLFLKLL